MVSGKIPTLGYRMVWQSSCKDKPLNGIHVRDWVNKYLVYQPISIVSYPAMVHRTVLPRIGPSYFAHFQTMTMILITSIWLSIHETSQNPL